MRIQKLMRIGAIEYVWSDMLSKEVSDNPFPSRRKRFLEWIDGASSNVAITSEVVSLAAELMQKGLKQADALHVSCAAFAGCDWFFTTDKLLLRKIHNVGSMRIANPVEFIMEGEDYENE